MIELLQFIFSGFWTFIGSLILLSIGGQILLGVLGLVVALFRGRT